jgi:hypothetical protein
MDAGAHATGGRRGWAGCCARKDEHPPHAVQGRSHGRRRTYGGGIGVEGLGLLLVSAKGTSAASVQDRSHGRRRTYEGGIGVEGLGCFWCQRREHLPHLCRRGTALQQGLILHQ